MANGKPTTLTEVRDELRIANRLMIISLIREGIQQKDIGATVGLSESAVSKMFPKGILKRIGQMTKNAAAS